MFEQFMYHLQLQNQPYQDQVNRQMNEANQHFERLLSLQGNSIKHGDPPRYSGKLIEDLELWIFQTQEYYQSQRDLMEEDSSTFVTLISNNLGKTLRARFRPTDVEYNLRERLIKLRQSQTINDYVSEFHNLLAQTEIPISELEKRLYFQSDLQAVTIATNFEFAHFANKPPTKPNDRHPPKKFDKPGKTPKSDEDKSQNDWKKSATCHKCGKKGHIAPDCKSHERTETNNYISGSFYAILKSQRIFEELARDLNLAVREDPTDMITVDLGLGQSVRQPKKTVEMSLNIPGFPILTGPFLVMPIPENNDVILGMIWLREQNPIIDWNALTLQPRASSDQWRLQRPDKRSCRNVGGRRRRRQSVEREILNHYKHVGHQAFEHKAAQVSLSKLLEAANGREVMAVMKSSPSLHEAMKSANAYDQRGLVVPDNEDLKNRVISENHNTDTAGHPGYFKTYIAVQKKYYWPRMSKYIQHFVNTCEHL
ncbi:TPA: hypothetical protein N0F65_011698 [Lagenidium giganteum]|uniref:CCHC-type domain-containing protein n=1 Tax=Lagenidium giganteum TaxID=4803 RepID=A0AAV2YW58_9STRA|nr:TPA: hypothetical protein N0F65_011698 [Lagenidium giganteum]